MISDVGMSEKKEEGKMAVTCPLCLKKGVQSRVRLFQINYSEALVTCENPQCPFPLLGGHITNIVRRRDFRNMKDDVCANNPVSDDSKDATESSSQSKPATVRGEVKSGSIPHPKVSDTSDTAVINEPASDPELVDGQFSKFKFAPSTPVQSQAKKKPKTRYYTGGRKRRPNKKPVPKTQNIDVKSES